jgi:hypothetical protein
MCALRNFALEKQNVFNQNKLKSKNYNLRYSLLILITTASFLANSMRNF